MSGGENGQKFIETVPKRGYRFVADVKEVNGESAAANSAGMGAPVSPVAAELAPAPPPARIAATTELRKPLKITLGVFGLLALTLASVGLYLRFKPEPHIESLAVLPFSADQQTEYLADGITESLINNLSRRYDEAIAEYRKLIDVAPDFMQTQRELGLAYEQKGMYQEAFSQFQKTLEMRENYVRTMIQADIGRLYAVWGKRTEARQVLAELLRKSEQNYVSAYDVAVIYASLGETERALGWLDKAARQRPYWLCWLKLDPRLDGLRADPRFQNLLQRVGQAH